MSEIIIPGKRVRLICDRLGWPVTHFKNRHITNLIRYLIHGRTLRYWWRVEATGGLYPIDWIDEATGAYRGPISEATTQGRPEVSVK